MFKLETRNINKSFDDKKVIEDISIKLNENEIISLVGASGCGKTTLFNIISGLNLPDSGEVYLDGELVTGKTGLVSYMLQKDLLLPYLTIEDNVSLPLVIKGEKKKEARKKVQSLIEEFGLGGTQKKYPNQLSGGMRQRAALLRTYMFSGNVALLDEPFSALDTITKSKMHEWYLGIMDKIKLSTIFITHDIDEAVFLSDRVYILSGNPGKIVKEIVIDEPRNGKSGIRDDNFRLSQKFLEYKKLIVESIS